MEEYVKQEVQIIKQQRDDVRLTLGKYFLQISQHGVFPNLTEMITDNYTTNYPKKLIYYSCYDDIFLELYQCIMNDKIEFEERINRTSYDTICLSLTSGIANIESIDFRIMNDGNSFTFTCGYHTTPWLAVSMIPMCPHIYDSFWSTITITDKVMIAEIRTNISTHNLLETHDNNAIKELLLLEWMILTQYKWIHKELVDVALQTLNDVIEKN